jgi:hypothetical protein
MTGGLFRVGKTKESHEFWNRVRGFRSQASEPNASRLDYRLDDFLPAFLAELRRLIIL